MKPDSFDSMESVEKRLRAALKQEAAFWQGQEPARLAMACRQPDRAKPRIFLRVLWTGSAAAAAAVALAIVLRTEEPNIFTDPADAPAVIQPLEDTSALYAGLPRFSPLHFPQDRAR
jgi:hypothetical protein